MWKLAATLWWFTAAPKPLKIQVFWGSPSPQGLQSPYILGDTTRPGHVTCVLVWSKSDRRRLRKTLHKQTDKQTDRQTNRHYENSGDLAVNQYQGVSTWNKHFHFSASISVPSGMLHSTFKHYLMAASAVCQLPPAVHTLPPAFNVCLLGLLCG